MSRMEYFPSRGTTALPPSIHYMTRNKVIVHRIVRVARVSSPSHCGKLNIVIRSPIAGLFVGKYGADGLLVGVGRLSRLADDSGCRAQFFSMNFTSDA